MWHHAVSQCRGIEDVETGKKHCVDPTQVGMVYEGGCVSWWLWGLVAPGLGRLKPDTTGSSHSGCLASDFSIFPSSVTSFTFLPWG